MAVTHLLPIEKFPFTKCGVDIQTKQVLWIADDEEGFESQVTCSNCSKLFKGIPMGVPLPATVERQAQEKVEDDAARIRSKYKDRQHAIAHFCARICAMKMDLRILAGGALSEEEKKEVLMAEEAMDTVESKLDFAAHEVKSEMDKLIKEGVFKL